VTREQNARRHPRSTVQKQLLVAWMSGTQKHVSRVENLALGGLFVWTQHSPAVGTSLQLFFNAPEGEVRVRAIVRNLVVRFRCNTPRGVPVGFENRAIGLVSDVRYVKEIM
jgi:PilZ domain